MKPIHLTCIIDDDEIYTFGVKKMLESLKLSKEIKTFSNGLTAIEWLKSSLEHQDPIPEIVLLDLNMPIMNGWQFIEELVEVENPRKAEITIYMISSSLLEEDIERAKQISEVSDYIVKPITLDQLSELFNNQ